MKKLLIALAAVLVTAASYAQGTVNFSTRVAGGINAPVNLNGVGVGPTYSAALFLLEGGSLTLIPSSQTTFRTGAGAAFVVPAVATIAGKPGGSTVSLRVRAWETAGGSYEAALGKGESSDFSVTLTEPPAFPADLPASVTGFNVTVVPEPSTIVLGALGAAALLFRRRK